MKKKVLSVLLSVAMISTLLVGCGNSSNPAPADDAATKDDAASNSDASSGEVEEITWMFWDDLNATEVLISLGYKDVVERFNKDYEGK